MAAKINIFGAGKKWLYSLMGKKVPVEEKVAPVAGNSSDNQPLQDVQEDSIASDIKMFKDFTKKSIDATKTMLSPFAKKGATTATGAAKTVSSSVDNKFIKMVVRSFIIIFFAVILLFIASYLFKRLKEEQEITHNGSVSVVTPVPFEPYVPSVYAQDPEILQLEEDLDILGKELNSVNIKEDGINPPKLDYDINF